MGGLVNLCNFLDVWGFLDMNFNYFLEIISKTIPPESSIHRPFCIVICDVGKIMSPSVAGNGLFIFF